MKEHKLILVIDDEEELLRMLSRILEMEGYEVITAADGKTGVTLIEKCNPDLVLLDIVMPGLDGFQVLDLIRQYSTVPVIMLTARSDIQSLRDALHLGADDYVKKPYGVHELLARIQSKLRRADSYAQSPEDETALFSS